MGTIYIALSIDNCPTDIHNHHVDIMTSCYCMIGQEQAPAHEQRGLECLLNQPLATQHCHTVIEANNGYNNGTTHTFRSGCSDYGVQCGVPMQAPIVLTDRDIDIAIRALDMARSARYDNDAVRYQWAIEHIIRMTDATHRRNT